MSPAIHIYFDGSFYLFEGNIESLPELLHFMNKIINPLITLTTEEEVEAFLNLN